MSIPTSELRFHIRWEDTISLHAKCEGAYNCKNVASSTSADVLLCGTHARSKRWQSNGNVRKIEGDSIVRKMSKSELLEFLVSHSPHPVTETVWSKQELLKAVIERCKSVYLQASN